jgi:5-methyltetrahydrofolate--homocysteine methyltransferase
MSPDQCREFTPQNRDQQDRLRAEHGARDTARTLLPLAEARARRTIVDWAAADLPKPAFLGTRIVADIPAADVVPFIDWSPFFHTWELRGRYPQILDDPGTGERARELFDDAQAMLAQIVDEKWLTLRAVYGFFPAQADGDDVVVFADESRRQPRAVFRFLRQQTEKPAGQPNQCLADFIAPPEARRPDYIGAFAVTAGIGIERVVEQFERDHDDYNSIMVKALADRLAEALAEMFHKRAREEWGYGRGENLSHEDLIRERYRGIRPAAGYPACPDHTEKATLWALLDAERATGIRLTETFAMYPAASVSGLYFSHPQARYFAVGKIGRDQVSDYAQRKQMTIAEVERWLAPNLGYEPGREAAATTR